MATGNNPSESAAIFKRLRRLEQRIQDLESRRGDNELLSASDISSLLSIHINTWFNWLRRFPRPPARLGQPGSYRWRRSSVLHFAERIGKATVAKEHETYIQDKDIEQVVK